MSEQLLPCPFCGSTHLTIYGDGVWCEGCSAHHDIEESDGGKEAAITLWNKRAEAPQAAFNDGDGVANCAECGAFLEHVRPGKHQHPTCSQAPSVIDLGDSGYIAGAIINGNAQIRAKRPEQIGPGCAVLGAVGTNGCKASVESYNFSVQIADLNRPKGEQP